MFLCPTMTRIGSRSTVRAIASTPCGSVALNKRRCRRGFEHAAMISSICVETWKRGNLFDEAVLEELVALVENEDFGVGKIDDGGGNGADEAQRRADETVDRLLAVLEDLPGGLEGVRERKRKGVLLLRTRKQGRNQAITERKPDQNSFIQFIDSIHSIH